MKQKRVEKKKISYRPLVTLGVLVVVLGFLFWLYSKPTQSKAKLKMLSSANLPVGYGFGKVVSFREFNTVARFNLHGEGASDTWGRYTDYLLVDKLARQLKFSVSDSDVSAEVAMLAETSGKTPEQVYGDFSQLYGLDRSVFKQYVVMQNLKKNKVAADFNKNAFAQDKRALDFNSILSGTKNFASFTAKAKDLSEDPVSKSLGASIGFKKKSDLLPEVQGQLDFSKMGVVQAAYSRLGAHLFYIKAIDTTDKMSPSYDMYQIFFKIDGFEKYLADEKKKEVSFFLLD